MPGFIMRVLGGSESKPYKMRCSSRFVLSSTPQKNITYKSNTVLT